MDKIIYVERISEEMGLTVGYSKTLPLAHKNLLAIYGQDLLDKFRQETNDNGVFRFVDKYCQFIFFVETALLPEFTIVLRFLDCKKDVNLALDFYTAASSKLTEAERDKFMQLFSEIETLSMSEYARLEILKF